METLMRVLEAAFHKWRINNDSGILLDQGVDYAGILSDYDARKRATLRLQILGGRECVLFARDGVVTLEVVE